MNEKDARKFFKLAGVQDLSVNGKMVKLFTTDGSSAGRKKFLIKLAKDIKGAYSSSGGSAGSIRWNGLTIYAKPAAKEGSISTSVLGGLNAGRFALKGKKGKFKYGGVDVDVYTFSSAKQVEESVIYGLHQSVRSMSSQAVDNVEQFFKTGEALSWSSNVPEALIIKLGVYLGEMLIGWNLLAGEKYLHPNPFKGKVKFFHLPSDPIFKGVDSFIEMADGSFYAISSKFGVGASASLISNVLPIGVENFKRLRRDSEFRKFVAFIVKERIDLDVHQPNVRLAIYSYGIYELLGINRKDVNPADIVFKQISTPKIEEQERIVRTRIMAWKGRYPNPTKLKSIQKDLPLSISHFFNILISDLLQNDPTSVAQIKDILTGKDYWQVNLDKNKWLNGVVSFKAVHSKDSSLTIIGGKSSPNDPKAKQGWINYTLNA